MAHLYRLRGYQVKAFERVCDKEQGEAARHGHSELRFKRTDTYDSRRRGGNIVGNPEEWSVEVFNVAKPLHVRINEHVLKTQENQLLSCHTWPAEDWHCA